MPFDASADAARQFGAEMRARLSVNILCPSRPSNFRVAKYSLSEDCSLYLSQYAMTAFCNADTVEKPKGAAAALSPPYCRASAATLWP
jgi:hypothetical protein